MKSPWIALLILVISTTAMAGCDDVTTVSDGSGFAIDLSGDFEFGLLVSKSSTYLMVETCNGGCSFGIEGKGGRDGEDVVVGIYHLEAGKVCARMEGRGTVRMMFFDLEENVIRSPGRYRGSARGSGDIFLVYPFDLKPRGDYRVSFRDIFGESEMILFLIDERGNIVSKETGRGGVTFEIEGGRGVAFLEVLSSDLTFELDVSVSETSWRKLAVELAKKRCSEKFDAVVKEFNQTYNGYLRSPEFAIFCFRIDADIDGGYTFSAVSTDTEIGLLIFKGDSIEVGFGVGRITLETELKVGSNPVALVSKSRSARFSLEVGKVPIAVFSGTPMEYSERFRNGDARIFRVRAGTAGVYLVRINGSGFETRVRGRDFEFSQPLMGEPFDIGLYLDSDEEFDLEVRSGPGSDYVDSVSIERVMTVDFGVKLEFTCSGRKESLHLVIPKELYRRYKNTAKPFKAREYASLVSPEQVKTIVDAVGRECGGRELLEALIEIVQGLRYLKDEIYGDYPKYPIETLVEEGGDCEDKSILLASLLKSAGFDVVLLKMKDHMAVGVSGIGTGGTCLEFNGRRYCYVESTSPGWKIGEMPKEFSGTDMGMIPLNRR